MKRFPTFLLKTLLSFAAIFVFINCPKGGGKGLLFFPSGGGESIVHGIAVFESSHQYASGSTYVIGSVVQNTTGSTKTLTIKNNGDQTVTLTGAPVVDKSGTHASQFVIDAQPADTSLDPGDSTTFTIHFAPDNSTGVKTAVLTINSDDPIVGNYSLNLSGTSTPTPVPRIEVKVGTTVLSDNAAGSKQTFSTQENTTSSAKTITVKNTGELTLTLSPAVDIAGTDPSYFVVTQPGDTSLDPNESTTFTIKFSPNNTTARNATVQIHSNDPNTSNFRILVGGTGTAAPAAQIEVTYVNNSSATENATTGSGHTFSFGSFFPGVSSTAKTFTIKNVGDASTTLNISGASVDNTTDFTVSTIGSSTLVTNASTTFTVTFNPQATGSKTATLTITSSNGNAGTSSSSTIDLSGTGGKRDVLVSWTNAKEKAVHRANGGYKICYKNGSTFTLDSDSGVNCVTAPWVSGTYAPNSKLVTMTSAGTYYIKVKSYSEYNTGSAFSSQTTATVSTPE
ncbi:choice-of-anchor D domain-containing protein [Leptospira wolffii]|uniref:Choice-of-anchor D domain-containing protein n=1 Tax=Leptospira wolffii TaxID=409998 RepID=A0ABV5BNE8_9LEPT|nr:choice-of-anchor D domain-containing protein [Leptospira wolffii]TGL52663.1 choice-of-anchor D domain-containing protein [Leptospira wolffii]